MKEEQEISPPEGVKIREEEEPEILPSEGGKMKEISPLKEVT